MDNTEQLKKRFNELASRAERLGIPTYTEFLTLAEQELLQRLTFPCQVRLFGGIPDAERKIGCFGEDDFISANPVVCIEIAPLSEKYAGKLGHRDYLGAIMSLGIKREMLGDIVTSGSRAYLFCLEQIADFLISECTSIKHTSVKLSRSDAPGERTDDSKTVTVNIASERLDALVSTVFNLSRTDSARLISQQRVFINGAIKDNTSYNVKVNEAVSVRGMGKFIYLGINRTTRKGRLCANIKL